MRLPARKTSVFLAMAKGSTQAQTRPLPVLLCRRATRYSRTGRALRSVPRARLALGPEMTVMLASMGAAINQAQARLVASRVPYVELDSTSHKHARPHRIQSATTANWARRQRVVRRSVPLALRALLQERLDCRAALTACPASMPICPRTRARTAMPALTRAEALALASPATLTSIPMS